MRRSTDRILTTHVGALQRPEELSKAMAAHGQWADDVLDLLRDGVADVVRRQVDTGIDIVDDGEFGKSMWSRYVLDRLDGIEARERSLPRNPVFRGTQSRSGRPARGPHPVSPVLGQLARPACQRHTAREHRRRHAPGKRRRLSHRGGQLPART
jgi:hypothetical protein